MEKIIESILDTDIYKLYMLQAFYHQYPNAVGHWEFKCRNKDVKLGFLRDQVIEQMVHLSNLRLTKEEFNYLNLSHFGVFKTDFLEWLRDGFWLDASLVTVEDVDGELKIECRGKLIEVNYFEVFILAIVNELYFINDLETNCLDICDICDNGEDILKKKTDKLKDYPQLKFAEFGTRRRFSRMWQDYVIGRLIGACPNNIIGTSNIHFAMKHDIKPIGTVAHEFSMAHLGLVDRAEQAQSRALHIWQQEYSGELGIALSDTFTTDSFLMDFNYNLSNVYKGVRQDSGDPIVFGEKMIYHYKMMNIDPRTKDIIFSDSLTVDKAISIWKHFAGRIGVSFGIGTHFTNDLGRTPLNIVMKLMSCNGVPCVKLSDDIGKAMGDPDMVERVKKAYGVG